MDEKKITVSKFIEGFNKMTNEDLKRKYVKSHITTTYASILSKVNILNLMNEKSVVRGDIEYIDLTASKINLVIAILILYTDIEVDKDEKGETQTLEAYDKLQSTGALKYILEFIGSDIEELMSVQANVMDTWHNANSSVEAFIAKQVTRFSGLFGGLANISIEKLVDAISDEKKMNKIISIVDKISKK